MNNRLIQARIDSKIPLKDISEITGITCNSIAAYEAGARIPRDSVKEKLSKLYGVSVGELFK